MDGVYTPRANHGAEVRFNFDDNQHRTDSRVAQSTGTDQDLSEKTVNVAGIESLNVPDTWSQRTETYISGRGTISTFSPGGNSDLVLGVLDKGTRLNPHQQNNFDDVLALADPSGRPKLLLPSQIKSITDALGKTSVGDNQYSNHAKPPDPSAPVFKVLSAQVITVDGKPVVEIEGQYLDQNGQRVRDFVGIFGKGADGKVNEMFMQSSSKDEFNKGRKVYKDALQSLDWK